MDSYNSVSAASGFHDIVCAQFHGLSQRRVCVCVDHALQVSTADTRLMVYRRRQVAVLSGYARDWTLRIEKLE